MYQVNIPMIYVELEKRNAKQMAKIISAGSSIAVLFYIMVGIFGYACFASTNSDGVNQLFNLCKQNILQADFNGSVAI